MKKINYSQIYSKVCKGFSKREKNIISQRFGVMGKSPQTLEAIGKKNNITRERVRQIIEKSFSEIRENHVDLLKKVFEDFETYFKKAGNFKNEKIVLDELGGDKNQSYVLFLLNLGESFSRICESKNFLPFWTIDKESTKKIKKMNSLLKKEIKDAGKPQKKKYFISNVVKKHDLKKDHVISFLEISKEIGENNEREIGLSAWSMIKPRGVRDKSYLVLQKENKPLHFREVAELIDERGYGAGKKTLSQTVHNELIKDGRFVLVGRGTYALREAGYTPGTVKDVIFKILKDHRESLSEEEIVEKVLEQRSVAKSTVLINLHNQKFTKDSQKRYKLRDVQTA